MPSDIPRKPDADRDTSDVSEDEVWATGPSYLASNKPLARLVARPVREFLRIEASGSILLLLAAAAALIWANSPWASSYDAFWHTVVGIDLGGFRIEETLQHWVNDALMVIFFFVVGLEIKYELVTGGLRDPKTAALPIVAAIGGMLVPAGLYLLIAGGGAGRDGWGIPMATDIAFAVGVLGLLGRRIPSAARLFLLTLAIVDDIGAIIVIAAFYTDDLHLEWLALALVLLGVMIALRMLRVWSLWVYAVLGFFVWFAMLESGVHATLAGVAIGLITPATSLLREDVARSYAQRALRDRHLDPEELSRLRFLLNESVPVVERLQTSLHPLSSYVVLPIFALANAGVALGGGALGDALTSAVGLGIMVGLVVGKPLGILVACLIAVRLGLGRLPDHTTWPMVIGLGSVAGIGFTVSIFIAGLSFPGSDVLTSEAKVGILVASLVAAVIGTVLLLAATRGHEPEPLDAD
ncbi:Na+/H+ antiporter NhaA [Nocardioides terrigena]|uniref:Na+/H+ antiporter NhaA n=1 Tax=Nocardioides terrigena TaxID=424797 RepID=UPI000D312114|nr:Na+/H+ antiporter NhaA [Nocardioides terrigena]